GIGCKEFVARSVILSQSRHWVQRVCRKIGHLKPKSALSAASLSRRMVILSQGRDRAGEVKELDFLPAKSKCLELNGTDLSRLNSLKNNILCENSVDFKPRKNSKNSHLETKR
ncbi:MAG: hypothetical protein AB2392_22365, partial [Neobacillus sp.]